MKEMLWLKSNGKVARAWEIKLVFHLTHTQGGVTATNHFKLDLFFVLAFEAV